MFFQRQQSVLRIARISLLVMTALASLAMSSSPIIASAQDRQIVVDMLMGEPVHMDAMLDDLAGVRVIYAGEIHSIARHHRLQTELLTRLSERGASLALGMEMFAEEQQSVLDSWQSGTAGIDDLLVALGMGKWTNLKDYGELLLAARSRKVPIKGLNASDKLVRNLARKGVQGLTEEERNQLPTGFDKVNPQLDRLLRLRLRVHKAFQEKSLESIIMAQAVRDATMARGVVRFLGSPEGGERVMLVVAGSGHLSYGLGIPERVSEGRDLPYRIVLFTESGELVLSDFEKRHSVPVEIKHEDLRFIRAPLCDYLFVTPLKTPQPDSKEPDLASME